MAQGDRGDVEEQEFMVGFREIGRDGYLIGYQVIRKSGGRASGGQDIRRESALVINPMSCYPDNLQPDDLLS